MYSEKQAKKAARGRVRKSLFLAAEGTVEISTDRVFGDKLSEIAEIATCEGRSRAGAFQGSATVSAKRASDDDRQVLASPTCKNPYHADIVLPKEVISDRNAQGRHAQSLADAACWLPRPA